MPSKPRAGITPEQRAVGERLQEALDRKNMTHQEFADLSGKSLRTIEGYVAGEFSPKAVLKPAKEYLGVSANYLLDGEDGAARYITYGEFAHWRKSVDEELDRLRGMLIQLEAKNGTKKVALRRKA